MWRCAAAWREKLHSVWRHTPCVLTYYSLTAFWLCYFTQVAPFGSLSFPKCKMRKELSKLSELFWCSGIPSHPCCFTEGCTLFPTSSDTRKKETCGNFQRAFTDAFFDALCSQPFLVIRTSTPDRGFGPISSYREGDAWAALRWIKLCTVSYLGFCPYLGRSSGWWIRAGGEVQSLHLLPDSSIYEVLSAHACIQCTAAPYYIWGSNSNTFAQVAPVIWKTYAPFLTTPFNNR